MSPSADHPAGATLVRPRLGPLRAPAHSRPPRFVAARAAGVAGAGAGVCWPSAGSVRGVRCPACSSVDDKVVDSRASDDGSAIRRRRECLDCTHRFTTFERVDEAALTVVKTTGERQVFDREKLIAGVVAAVKNRPVTDEQIEALATGVEDALRRRGGDVESTRIGVAVLERLRDLDEVAYLRFASVYKDFTGIDDFADELRLLSKHAR